jgi:hypothetical protein
LLLLDGTLAADRGVMAPVVEYQSRDEAFDRGVEEGLFWLLYRIRSWPLPCPVEVLQLPALPVTLLNACSMSYNSANMLLDDDDDDAMDVRLNP